MDKLTNKRWWQAAGTRCLKTFCQTAISLLGIGTAGLLDIDWLGVLSASALAALISILTSLAGLPEVEEE